MTNEKQKPIAEIRIGRIKTGIWKHESENGDQFSVKTPIRTYRLPEEKRKNKKDNGYRETEFLGRDDLLIAAKVLSRAHDFIVDYQEPESE